MTKAQLTQGPIGKTFISMTLPMIAGVYAMITIFLVDTYFVSRLGTKSLAAISFTFPITMLLIHFVLGVGTGTASVVSRAVGAGNTPQVRRLVTDGLLLTLLIVSICSVMGLLTINPLFKLLGAKGKVLQLIGEYMQVWYVGIGFFIIPMVANNIIRATGDAKFPGIIMVVAALANLILDPILIFGYLGVPAMGIKGAALATVLAFGIAFIGSLSVIYFRDKLITFEFPSFKHTLRSWKEIIYIGIPAGATNIIIHFTFAVIVRLLASYGEGAVAGFGVATRIETFALAVFFAMSSIVGPFVGQNYGAKKNSRIKAGLVLCFRFCFVWGLLMAIMLALFSDLIVGVFDKNSVVITVASLYLLIVPLSYGAEGTIMMSTSSFNALGKPIPSAIISLVRMFVLYIPLAYIGKWYFGMMGIFIAAFFANIIMGLAAMNWNLHYFRREEKLLKLS